jgi:hypothetical protein
MKKSYLALIVGGFLTIIICFALFTFKDKEATAVTPTVQPQAVAPQPRIKDTSYTVTARVWLDTIKIRLVPWGDGQLKWIKAYAVVRSTLQAGKQQPDQTTQLFDTDWKLLTYTDEDIKEVNRPKGDRWQ